MAKSNSNVNSVTVTLATLVAVLLTSNAFLFIMGCVCGHCLSQKGKKLAKQDHQPDPVYENWQMKTTRVEGQELELEMNEAYGHLRSENVTGN